MTAWCLVYVSVTFTVMRDKTSLNSGGYHTKNQCHMLHVTYPDPATTRIRPGTNDRVPGSGSRQNSLPVPPICRQATCCHISSSLLYIAVLTTQNYHRLIQVFQMFIFVNRCSRCTRCSFCSVVCDTNYKLQASLQQCTVVLLSQR